MPRKRYGQACEHTIVEPVTSLGGQTIAYQCRACPAIWPVGRHEGFTRFVARIDKATFKRWGPRRT